MDVLDLARWQFAVTTIYHFFFVPITIGLSMIVAGVQTAWVLTGREHLRRLTMFLGKLLVIVVAMGIVTGLVQEFQFGLNWSAFSRFAGDVVGVPLAIEGLLAFFLEATFLGLWIFGWNRLHRLVHLACIWVVALAAQVSAYVILAVNSWMQHPTGFRYDAATGRVRLADFPALLANPTAIAAGLHTATACFVTGGAFVAGIALWRLARRRHDTDVERRALRTGAVVGCAVVLAATPAFVLSGDHQMKLMAREQPMKVAAAEALYDTARPAPLSLLTIGTLDGQREVFTVKASNLLSWLAFGEVDAPVRGIHQLQQEYVERYGPGWYVPNVPMAYWAFRSMVGIGAVAALGALIGLVALFRRPRWLRNRWLVRGFAALPFVPLAANTAGWVFTEMGRQPWLAFGLFRTADGVSPETSAAPVGLSLLAFVLLYAGLGWLEVRLLKRAASGPLGATLHEPVDTPGSSGVSGSSGSSGSAGDEDTLALSY